MSHPAWEWWIDERRGVRAQRLAEQASAHLDAGCRTCRRRRAVVTSVAALARNDCAILVPTAATRAATAVFAAGNQHQRRARVPALQLSFDSALAPLPAAVRGSAGTVPRLLLWRSPSHTLNVQLERGATSGRRLICGQLQDRSGEPVRGAAVVILIAGDRVAASTITGKAGEFSVEAGNEPQALFLDAGRGRRMSASLA